ncbi:butyrophilin subfamily 2 member A2-like [Penaeus chinensis]|uniref:butyrophilin subfamily 2 member A2-like n=1 Tax=Penaeus chinensis TaxID=139456 RepID=UPI001FB5F37A|nr:butyrophilin subfamily 2 member A2-like [Penaeus chinensis]
MTPPCLLATVLSIVLSTAVNVACQDEHLWSVTGVAGRSSDLPCYLNPRTPGDRPKLVLWYKRGFRTPIYSHDGRKPEMRQDFKQERRVLNVNRGAATLTLNNLTVSDAGVYECRVDFFKSPTHTNFVNLTIVDEPSHRHKMIHRPHYVTWQFLYHMKENAPEFPLSQRDLVERREDRERPVGGCGSRRRPEPAGDQETVT